MTDSPGLGKPGVHWGHPSDLPAQAPMFALLAD